MVAAQGEVERQLCCVAIEEGGPRRANRIRDRRESGVLAADGVFAQVDDAAGRLVESHRQRIYTWHEFALCGVPAMPFCGLAIEFTVRSIRVPDEERHSGDWIQFYE